MISTSNSHFLRPVAKLLCCFYRIMSVSGPDYLHAASILVELLLMLKLPVCSCTEGKTGGLENKNLFNTIFC